MNSLGTPRRAVSSPKPHNRLQPALLPVLLLLLLVTVTAPPVLAQLARPRPDGVGPFLRQPPILVGRPPVVGPPAFGPAFPISGHGIWSPPASGLPGSFSFQPAANRFLPGRPILQPGFTPSFPLMTGGPLARPIRSRRMEMGGGAMGFIRLGSSLGGITFDAWPGPGGGFVRGRAWSGSLHPWQVRVLVLSQTPGRWWPQPFFESLHPVGPDGTFSIFVRPGEAYWAALLISPTPPGVFTMAPQLGGEIVALVRVPAIGSR